MTSKGPLAIEAVELTKSYPGGVEALSGLTFEVAQGQIFGMLGPNGAGKSTAVRILTSLSKPDQGAARVAGFDVLAHPGEVRKRIGAVAQRSTVDLTATGRENLSLQGRLFRVPGHQLARRVAELLDLFDLDEAADRLASTYSGGMQRRLDVAMSIIHQPEVLFLDEPTAGLDPESRAVMWSEISRLCREGMTILLTTHYLEEADRLASQLVILDKGAVVASGTPDELKQGFQGDFVAIELPQREKVDEARRILTSIEGVGEAHVEEAGQGVKLYVHTTVGVRAVPTVAAALERAGIDLVQISLSRPSLDDVFLSLTGRTFHRAQSSGAAPASPEGAPEGSQG